MCILTHIETPRISSSTDESAVIYLSAHKQTHSTDQYHHALHYIKQAFPTATILDAASLWTSAQHWRDQYEKVLSPVTHLFLLPNASGYCGRGGYTEWDFLRSRALYSAAFVRDDSLWAPIDLVVIDPYDWVDFAAIRHLPTGKLSVMEAGHGCS
jgi:hypothetical protein